MGMFGQIRSAVNSILPSFFEDEDLRILVTWKKFAGSTFNEARGVNEDTYTDYLEVPTIKIEKEIGAKNAGRTFPPGPWSMSSGEVLYLFQDEDVPEGASIRDMIVDNGYTYSVSKIYPVFNLIVKVEVEGYA